MEERSQRVQDVNEFDQLRIGMATAEQIRMWSNGEVRKPETINYRTLKPERDGLFCERIFGPTKDWECACGKYKRVRFKGIICERCGVEVTRARVRRERMGHIELAAPVAHIWFFKGVPSRLGYLLDLAPKDLEKIIYFASNVITHVETEKRERDLPKLESQLARMKEDLRGEAEAAKAKRSKDLEKALKELEAEGAKSTAVKARQKEYDIAVREIDRRVEKQTELMDRAWEEFTKLEPKRLVPEDVWRQLRDSYGEYFRGGMGAEAIKDLLRGLNLAEEIEALRLVTKENKGQKRIRAIKRLKVMEQLLQSGNTPMAMILDVNPVIPPDLRPMVQLDGGRFATSDLNDLYRRVINRNNRLKRLLDLGAPEIIVNNEKRMLQEAVDALFDNGRRGRPVTGPGNRPLKSLSDMLKGKQGRFRQNLLGKRVDYSGRSVIVVGPDLKLHQCGLPKIMALELFKPFVMKKLVDAGLATNIKSAKRMVERARPQVWDVLEDVISDHPVMLNRAPTLHRLGIQAFEPILVEGKAIQIHPLVCPAFNADFDGDQMAVHVPLSPESQAEARLLMLSTHNILSPAHGRPTVTPTHDMILGSWYLTAVREGAPGEGTVFGSPSEAVLAFDTQDPKDPWLHLHAKVKIRLDRPISDTIGGAPREVEEGNGSQLVETTVGMAILNETLPRDFPWVNQQVGKKEMGLIIDALISRYEKAVVAESLDKIKSKTFHMATRAGISIAVDDVVVPPDKPKILDRYEREAERVEVNYSRGVLTDDERRQELIEIWTKATDEVARAMEANFDELNSIFMMAHSGARGNIKQIQQLAGMRGLVANPKGQIIPRPIKANFREGLTVLEYFISTHGARKGLADTALRTADSGYLTRRLVDVAQEIIVREVDCGTDKGLTVNVAELRTDTDWDARILSRVLAEPVKQGRETVLAAGSEVGRPELAKLRAAEAEEIVVRTVLTCESRVGVCAMCYGRNLATGRLVDIGEAVGIIAAQSIGEPGTQLTMRTFHTGGVAGEDITHGLPRVVELFEARNPKGAAALAEISGTIAIEEKEKSREIIITDPEGEERRYTVPRRVRLRYNEGDQIQAGEQLFEGAADPKEILKIRGINEVQRYLANEVQQVYASQGVTIHDKHIELVAKQMLRRISVVEPGDTEFLPGQLVDRNLFQATNQRVVEAGGEPGRGRPELMGITKAALATDSWLAAASFQETTRVLTEASLSGRSDPLLGLKENVIIGKLIPAGTGMRRYRSVKVKPLVEVPSWHDDDPSAGMAEDGELESDVALRDLLTMQTDAAGAEE
ncbi:MAG TPA: DNA-directed RNA polymerase subunit beta' [Actinomycetota bacterium]|nr:DNA-directed RNA polymerase subunit beta' [Actinomycetota bacterium]